MQFHKYKPGSINEAVLQVESVLIARDDHTRTHLRHVIKRSDGKLEIKSGVVDLD